MKCIICIEKLHILINIIIDNVQVNIYCTLYNPAKKVGSVVNDNTQNN